MKISWKCEFFLKNVQNMCQPFLLNQVRNSFFYYDILIWYYIVGNEFFLKLTYLSICYYIILITATFLYHKCMPLAMTNKISGKASGKSVLLLYSFLIYMLHVVYHLFILLEEINKKYFRKRVCVTYILLIFFSIMQINAS